MPRWPASAQRTEAPRRPRHSLQGAEKRYVDHHVAYSLAAANAQLRRADDAVHWLRRAAETGFPCLPWFERDVLLDPVRDNPEFIALLAEVRVAWERARERHAPQSAAAR